MISLTLLGILALSHELFLGDLKIFSLSNGEKQQRNFELLYKSLLNQNVKNVFCNFVLIHETEIESSVYLRRTLFY